MQLAVEGGCYSPTGGNLILNVVEIFCEMLAQMLEKYLLKIVMLISYYI